MANLVERGRQWDTILLEILQQETSDTKSDYYQKFFLQSHKENCDLNIRIAYRLSQSTFNQSVIELDKAHTVEANRLIKKANQYYNQFIEYGLKYGE